MRRTLTICLALFLALFLAACGSSPEGSSSDSGTKGDSTGVDTAASDATNDVNVGNIGAFNANPNCLKIDRVDASRVVPAAGVQVRFRLLDCDGNAVKPLEPGELSVINDETQKPFNESTEGGSASAYATLKDTQLYSVLA